ncbi:MAG: hypothetical protein ACFCVE_05715 [Phycisphaerae bacterium]
MAVFAALALLVALAAAGPGLGGLLYGLLADGLLCLLWLAAAGGIGWGTLRLCGLLSPPASQPAADAPPSQPLPADGVAADPLLPVTALAVGLGLLGLAVLALGSAGLLNGVSAWLLVAGGCASLLPLAGRGGDRLTRLLAVPAGGNWLLLPVAGLLGFAMVAVFVPPGLLWRDEPHGYDVVSYHLQLPAQWFAAGAITRPTNNVYGYFPLLLEMHDLLAFHLRGSAVAGMYLGQLMHLSHAAAFVWAVWAAVRPAGRLAASGVALLAAGVPYVLLLGTVAYNEPGLLLFTTLALAWALRGLAAGAGVRPWLLAGAAAGFACGTKLTAFPLLLAGLPAALLLGTLPRRPGRAVLLPLAAFVLVGLVAAGPWLVRTAVWSGGNPVFPQATALFGPGPFTSEQAQRWTTAHAATGEVTAPVALWHQVLSDWRYGFVFIPLGLAAVAAGFADAGRRVLLVWLLLLTIFWMSATHLQGRFFVPAVPALLLAAGRVNWRWWPGVVAATAGVCAVVGVVNAWPQVKDLRPFLGVTSLQELVYAMLPASDVATLQRHRGEVFLVGDAKAFWYTDVPSDRLHYRTVFDIAGDDATGDAFWPAWLGRPVDEVPADALIVVWPGELRRFYNTYRHLPDPPAGLLEQPGPFIMPAGRLR